MNTLSSTGEALIKSYEKLHLTAYQDEGGVWTCGWGHTAPYVVEGTTCTPALAEHWFQQDAFVVERAVDTALKAQLNQPQFDALCSFAYNVGVGAFEKSTLLKLMNERNFAKASDQFLVWDEVNGEKSEGLENRRKAEQAMFNGGDWQNPRADDDEDEVEESSAPPIEEA